MKCRVFALFTVTGRAVKKPIEIGDGVDMLGDGAYAMTGDRITATMVGARVSRVSADGLVIDGVEKLGSGRLVIQRWWCAVGDGKDGAK